MNKEFKAKSKAIDGLLRSTCKYHVCAMSNGDDATVSLYGTGPDLLFLAHKICDSIRAEIADVFNENVANELMKSVILNEEEIAKRNKEMLDEMEGKREIPEWLKKLMELADEEDDTTDEADSEEEDEQDDDDGDTPDITVRVDVHHHDGDDDNE